MSALAGMLLDAHVIFCESGGRMLLVVLCEKGLKNYTVVIRTLHIVFNFSLL